ncbi:MAG TPA: hypothetical protein VG838_00750 [Opitutaceae bacterium]|nr:hypothetical protein [Opitutaceae bacterium]
MNTQSIEQLSIVIWLGIACWLGFLAFRSRKYPNLAFKPVLWAAFLLFTFWWRPASPAGFGVIAFPRSFSWVEAAIALPVYDGSPRFAGISPPQFSMVLVGYFALFSISAAALISLWFARKRAREERKELNRTLEATLGTSAKG